MKKNLAISLCLVALFGASLLTLTAVAQTTPQNTEPQNTAPQNTSSQQRRNSDDDQELGEALFVGPLRSSGYGAFSTKFTPIQGQFGTLIGGYGGWFLNKTLLIGGGGYGLTTNIAASSPAQAGQSLSFGYGGIVLEYVGASDKVFHYAVQTMIGWGGVGFYRPRDFNFSNRSTSSLMVIEPSLMAELNITNFLRLNVSGGYRFVTGIELAGLTNADMSGVTMALNVKFGGF